MILRNVGYYFQLTTWRYIPQNGTIHNHSIENLKSCIIMKIPITPEEY
jgi:hypothetical protein